MGRVSAGASPAVQMLLRSLVCGPDDAVMIPTPQCVSLARARRRRRRRLSRALRAHLSSAAPPLLRRYPLYSASLALYGGAAAPYYLDEANGWSLSPAELERAHAAAVAAGKRVRGLAVINPGNPTGQCLGYDNLKQLIKWVGWVAWVWVAWV